MSYSPYKALRYPARIQAIKHGIPVGPVHVQIILSDLCNQACNFCAYRDPGYTSSQLFYVTEDGKKGLRKAGYEERNYNPNRMIPYDKVVEILDDCVTLGVEAVQFTGGGEPTVHPRFGDVVKQTVARGLKWSLVTNGVAWHNLGLVELCQSASWVRVSLDAGRGETYGRMRNAPASHWPSAIDAIRGLAALNGPTVGVGFVVTPDNWREVVDATEHAQKLGAQNIRISAQFSAGDERLFSEFYDEAAALCREAEKLTGDGFIVYNRFGEKLEDLRQRSPDYDRCGYQQFTTYIGGDLNLYRCCVYAYHPRGLLGSIKERRFRDVWPEVARGMAEFKARECERCQFNKINTVLDYALSPDEQQHQQFV